jgi:hypothetical protein
VNQKISVIIPTRERPDTLEYCLKTVTNQDYENIEIIVSDNYSCDETEGVVRRTNDSRIKYFNTGKRISMAHNFEFALSKVTEGWITVLGDDDGLLPNSLGRALEVVENSGQLALASKTCFYRWPMPGKVVGSILSIPMNRGNDLRDGKTSIRKLMKGMIGYAEMPMLYTGGIVSALLVNSIRGERGSFYRSCQPDIFSAIALSSVVGGYIYSHEPFAISGMSKNSTGGSWGSYKNGEPKGEMVKYASEENISFHPQVPLDSDGKFPSSVAALVYESYLQSIHLHEDFAEITPEQQLEVFLLTSGIYKESVENWGKQFAALHNVNFEKVNSKLRLKRWPMVISKLLAAFSNGVERYRVDSSFDLQIRDVHEASLVASAILRTRPSRLTSYSRTLRRCWMDAV